MPAAQPSTRFRLVKKIAVIVFGGIAAILVVASAGIYGISAWKLNAHYAVAGPALRVTPAASMVVEGERLARVNGCIGCHGDNLAGHVFVDRLFIGRLSGHNLTRVVPEYTNEQLANLIRGGVKSDGTGIVFMPSHTMVRLADADVAVISMARSRRNRRTCLESCMPIHWPISRRCCQPGLQSVGENWG